MTGDWLVKVKYRYSVTILVIFDLINVVLSRPVNGSGLKVISKSEKCR